MSRLIRNLCTALFVVSVILAGVLPAQAAVIYKAPQRFRFVQWNNTSFTSCRLAWDTALDSAGNSATDYEIRETWTNGSHYWHAITGKTAVNINNHEYNHVVVASVRARWKKTNTKTGASYYAYSPWSAQVFVTPMPVGVTGSMPYKNDPYVKISWNPVYGSSGYNVFLTTNPKGQWYWNQSTAAKATVTSATIRRFRGKKLKAHTNYYLRVITRRKQNGVFRSVPVPAADYYSLRFILKSTTAR